MHNKWICDHAFYRDLIWLPLLSLLAYHVTVSSVITSIFTFISYWSCYIFKTIAQSRHLIE